MRRVLHSVIYSGGMDSLTLLASVPQNYMGPDDALQAISFDYGQRHVKELAYARRYCASNNINHQVIDVKFLGKLLVGSSQTDASVPVPEGAYDEPSMKLTVVPGRNTIMLALALGITESKMNVGGYDSAVIYYGAHAGDHYIYPDCRAPYTEAMRHTIEAGTEGRVTLYAPFQHLTKGQVAGIGSVIGVNFADSWTCYKGEAEPCGVCGSCDERREAFKEAGITDPLLAPA